MRWAEHVASTGKERRVLSFGGKWINRATLEGNIMCISQIWWEDVKWSGLTWLRIVTSDRLL